MKKDKISLVLTILNEENTIGDLLDSISKQSLSPDEILFVDGGSQDETLVIIKKWAKNKSFVRIFSGEKKNIAQGRNYGIKKSCGDVIVTTDAGCVLSKNWFRKISEPFRKNKNTDVVCGFYTMRTSNIFEKCLACYLGVLPKKISKNFLPSARSMGFTKKIWIKAGKFPEFLSGAGEDTLFNIRLKKIGAKFYLQKKAIVFWSIPKNVTAALGKFFWYAKGDAEIALFGGEKIWQNKHIIKIMTIYLRYVLLLILAISGLRWQATACVLLYILWSICKNYSSVDDMRAVFLLPFLQIVSDISIMLGFFYGFSTGIERLNYAHRCCSH